MIELTEIDDAKREVAELTAVLQEQIELLKMAQTVIKSEMVADLNPGKGGTPILHRDVAQKLNGITRSLAEAGRVQVQVAKAHKELAAAMTATERIRATVQYLKGLPNTVLNPMLSEVLTDRRQMAEKVTKTEDTGPTAAVDVLAGLVRK
jgi:hypothetical protein